MQHYRKHMLINALDRTLPIYIEAMGWNEWQEEFIRPEGYPYYHWLQTTGGEGVFECSDKKITLSPNQGILLKPDVPHRYVTLSDPWSTWYITFTGNQVPFIVSSLGLATSTVIRWDSSSPLSTVHRSSRRLASRSFNFSGMDGSAYLYRFLMNIKRYGQVENQRSIAQHTNRLMPLFQFLDHHYSDPDIGLPHMAEYVGVSPQQLNYLVRTATGLSPYQYLIHLRIQKSKELLIHEKKLTIKIIASMVGFLDTSHFISTFRKLESTTPERYRNLHTSFTALPKNEQ